jgi:hypothetical protein
MKRELKNSMRNEPELIEKFIQQLLDSGARISELLLLPPSDKINEGHNNIVCHSDVFSTSSQ